MPLNVQINTTANTQGLNAAQKAAQSVINNIKGAAGAASKALGAPPKGAAFRSQAMQEAIQSAADISRLGTSDVFRAFQTTGGARGGLSAAALGSAFQAGPNIFQQIPEAEGVARTIGKTLGRVEAGAILSPRAINDTIGQLQTLDEMLGTRIPVSIEETSKQFKVVETELGKIGSRIGGARTAVLRAQAAGRPTKALVQSYDDLRARQQFLRAEMSRLTMAQRDLNLAMASTNPRIRELIGNMEAMSTSTQTSQSRVRMWLEQTFPWVSRAKAVAGSLNLMGGGMQGMMLASSAMEGNMMGLAFSLIFLRFAMLPAAAAGVALTVIFSQIAKAAKTTRETAKEIGSLTKTLMSSGQTYQNAIMLSTDLYKTYARNIDAIKILAGPTAGRMEDRMKLLAEASGILARNGLKPTAEIMDSVIAASLRTGKSMADVAQSMIDLVKPGKITLGSFEDFRSNLDNLIPMWYNAEGNLMSYGEKLQKQLGIYSMLIGQTDGWSRALTVSDLMVKEFGSTLAGIQTDDPVKAIKLLTNGTQELTKLDEKVKKLYIAQKPRMVAGGLFTSEAEFLAKFHKQLAEVIKISMGLKPPPSNKEKFKELFGEIDDGISEVIREMGYLTPEQFLEMAQAEYEGIDASDALAERLKAINSIDFSDFSSKSAPINQAFTTINTTLDSTISKLKEIYEYSTPSGKTAGDYLKETGTLPVGGGGITGAEKALDEINREIHRQTGEWVSTPPGSSNPEYWADDDDEMPPWWAGLSKNTSAISSGNVTYNVTTNINGDVLSEKTVENGVRAGMLETSRTAG